MTEPHACVQGFGNFGEAPRQGWIGIPAWDAASHKLAELSPSFIKGHSMSPGEAMELLSQAVRILHSIPEGSVQNPSLHAAAVLLLSAQMMSLEFDKSVAQDALAARLGVSSREMAAAQRNCFNLMHCQK